MKKLGTKVANEIENWYKREQIKKFKIQQLKDVLPYGKWAIANGMRILREEEKIRNRKGGVWVNEH